MPANKSRWKHYIELRPRPGTRTGRLYSLNGWQLNSSKRGAIFSRLCFNLQNLKPADCFLWRNKYWPANISPAWLSNELAAAAAAASKPVALLSGCPTLRENTLACARAETQHSSAHSTTATEQTGQLRWMGEQHYGLLGGKSRDTKKVSRLSWPAGSAAHCSDLMTISELSRPRIAIDPVEQRRQHSANMLAADN